MKFNEKLIELRKKEGLSQEELGYKLNVTRQTVSKWELGQTTPEMDKLIEISKIFNISVDELIKETEDVANTNVENSQTDPIKDQPIVENKSRNTKIVIILVLALVIVLVMMGTKIFSGISLFNKAKSEVEAAKEQGISQVFDLFNKATEMIFNQLDSGVSLNMDTNNIVNGFIENFNDMQKEYDNQVNEIKDEYTSKINENKRKAEVNNFNSSIELYSGTASKLFAETMLDNIVTSNKKNERKITVKYNKTKTQDTTEIKNIKKKIHNMSSNIVSFDISCEYDEDGYIYEVIIEKM